MYKLQNAGISDKIVSILHIGTNTTIPIDENNSDYQIYLKWLDGYEQTLTGLVKTSDGNQPLPADA